ncbi:MAG: hypothetical protein LBM12_01745 [Candidatus Nomurabacteria bacterium]|nr:hypothetical protein [Candidatus Nomurabacteria bacterium]
MQQFPHATQQFSNSPSVATQQPRQSATPTRPHRSQYGGKIKSNIDNTFLSAIIMLEGALTGDNLLWLALTATCG